MTKTPLPEGEVQRLAALIATGLLDSEHESVFDAVVALAAAICGAPMAAISLIDRDRQWFKASVGLEEAQTPRDDAFCAYTILQPDMLEVGDARTDVRFRDNPFVLGDAHVRFYAGMPLVTGEGHALGALCVIDRKPRRLDDMQRTALRHLGTVVERLIAARVESLQQQRALSESEARTQVIADHVPAVIGYADAQERVWFANRAFLAMAGKPREQVIGQSCSTIFGDGYDLRERFIKRVLSGKETGFERAQHEPDGVRHFNTRLVPDRDPDGRVRGFYGLTIDISTQRAAELLARQAERRLQLIADHIPAAISIIDRDHIYRYNNAAYEQALRRPLNEIVDRPVSELHGPDVYTQIRPHLERALQGHRSQFELRTDGERHLRGSYIPKRDEHGVIVGVFGMIQDQTDLKLAEDQLRRMAEYDALTGLPNRYRLYDVITQSGARAQRHGSARALLYLDVDRFKAINDRYGHAGGDAVLLEFARRLKAAVRATDTAARLAGDEFVVLLEDVDKVADAERAAAAIIAAMRTPVTWLDRQIAVGTSIGVAFSRRPEESADALLFRADAALYAAKAAGRNCWRVAADA